jgi:glucose-1-phosphate cytidylyltransferase
MIEIGGRPMLWHIMKSYAQHGFRTFIICLGYRGNIIKNYFLNYEAMNNDFTIGLGRKQPMVLEREYDELDFRVTLVDTGADTMTGARIKRIAPYVKTDTFMVTYGDGLSDVNIADELRFHRAHGRLATLVSVAPPSRFGVLDLSDAHEVRQFREKAQNEWINGGFFVFNGGVFDYLDDDPNCILERGPLERLAHEGQLMAYRHKGFWIGMDTYREFEMLNAMWEQGDAAWARGWKLAR